MKRKEDLGPLHSFSVLIPAHTVITGDVFNFKFKRSTRILYINSTETRRPQKFIQCYRLLPLGLFIVHVRIAVQLAVHRNHSNAIPALLFSGLWQNRYYTWGRSVWLFKYTMPISFQQVLIVLAVIVVLIPIWGRYNVAVLLFFLVVVWGKSDHGPNSTKHPYQTK